MAPGAGGDGDPRGVGEMKRSDVSHLELLRRFTEGIEKVAEIRPDLAEMLAGGHEGRRGAELVAARDALIAVMVDCGASEPWLGRMLNIDHSSVNHAKKRIEQRNVEKSKSQKVETGTQVIAGSR